VVELWTIPPSDLLAANDIGLIPWVPLAKIDGPPEPIFRECRRRIDRDAPQRERENLLTVTQFLARLNYNDPKLFQILGGRKAMIESPMVKELIADSERAGKRKSIIRFLIARFGPGARGMRNELNTITDDKMLDELTDLSATCPDLETIQKRLRPNRRKEDVSP
jgi:hypothetical protein